MFVPVGLPEAVVVPRVDGMLFCALADAWPPFFLDLAADLEPFDDLEPELFFEDEDLEPESFFDELDLPSDLDFEPELFLEEPDCLPPEDLEPPLFFEDEDLEPESFLEELDCLLPVDLEPELLPVCWLCLELLDEPCCPEPHPDRTMPRARILAASAVCHRMSSSLPRLE